MDSDEVGMSSFITGLHETTRYRQSIQDELLVPLDVESMLIGG